MLNLQPALKNSPACTCSFRHGTQQASCLELHRLLPDMRSDAKMHIKPLSSRELRRLAADIF